MGKLFTFMARFLKNHVNNFLEILHVMFDHMWFLVLCIWLVCITCVCKVHTLSALRSNFCVKVEKWLRFCWLFRYVMFHPLKPLKAWKALDLEYKHYVKATQKRSSYEHQQFLIWPILRIKKSYRAGNTIWPQSQKSSQFGKTFWAGFLNTVWVYRPECLLSW